jgi:hypothetical protein
VNPPLIDSSSRLGHAALKVIAPLGILPAFSVTRSWSVNLGSEAVPQYSPGSLGLYTLREEASAVHFLPPWAGPLIEGMTEAESRFHARGPAVLWRPRRSLCKP